MPDIPIELLATHANAYASANGIQVERRKNNNNNNNNNNNIEDDHRDAGASSYYECAPMSLLPNAYPKGAFDRARSVSTAFNQLVDRVSRDSEFLESTLGGGVAEHDPFTAKILSLYKEVYGDDDGSSNNAAHSADRLGIHRSDYMLHASSSAVGQGGEPYRLKQVELNTIAASFAGLACNIASLHKYLTTRFAPEIQEYLASNQRIVTDSTEAPTGVPENPALSRIPAAMKVAFDRYCETFADGDSNNKIVLFVVQEGETNTVDQRMLEFRLFSDFGVPVVRMSLTEASGQISVDEDGALKLGSMEIAVVYYRAGYAPTDYPDGDDGIEWDARLTLESSRAAKCPSLGYHLAGTKKVQQELARPGVLERFFPKEEEKEMVKNMRSVFAGLYSLGDDAVPEDFAAVRDALDGQEGRYVLKPQREGGGYNFYGAQLKEKLTENIGERGPDGSLTSLGGDLSEYILMQRLFPPQQQAILLRNGKVEGSGDSVSELGCYGTILVDPKGKVIHNEYAGFLLRTKFSNVDEGGVASGFATLSSPYLC